MISAREKSRELGKIAYDCGAIGLCLFFLVPVFWVLFCAFQSPGHLFGFPPNFDPRQFSLTNFQAVFETGDVSRYAMNSLIVAMTSSLITVFASSMAGFALAKYRFLGRQYLSADYQRPFGSATGADGACVPCVESPGMDK